MEWETAQQSGSDMADKPKGISCQHASPCFTVSNFEMCLHSSTGGHDSFCSVTQTLLKQCYFCVFFIVKSAFLKEEEIYAFKNKRQGSWTQKVSALRVRSILITVCVGAQL